MEEVNIAGVSSNISDTVDESILTQKHWSFNKPLFIGKKIGISISDNQDLLKLGYSPMHLQDTTIEFARYLLVHGAKLVYGGDLREGGYTSLFSELSKQYSTKETFNDFRFENYFAWPIYLKMTKSNELDFKQNKVNIHKVPPPDGLVLDVTKGVAPDTDENRTIWAKSLTYMRETINSVCDARIFLGGRVENFAGKYPGIVDEARLALRDNKPAYFIGAYGGSAKEITNLLLSKSSDKITEKYQFKDVDYLSFYNYWNEKEIDKIDYKNLTSFFTDYGMHRLCQNNGLSEDENERLFVTDNITEMLYYVLKGLTKIFNK